MDRKPVTRKELQRALVVNAATKPVNVAVPAAVAVLGLILGTVWLLPVAAVVYTALVVVTFFDSGEADKVADRMYGRDPAALKRAEETRAQKMGEYAPPIADLLENALSQEQAIRRVIVESDLPFDEVSTEVDQLVRAMEKIADRAQKVYVFLETQDRGQVERRLAALRAGDDDMSQADRAQLVKALEDQLQAIDALQRQLTRFRAEMEHTTTTLHTIYAQLVQISVATDAVGEQQVAEQIRSLREQVGAASQSIAEVFDENTPAELSA
jgi:predicted  nucleic acid-binding Zn-ribbon protein